MRAALFVMCLPLIVVAQTTFPTDFPAGAVPFEADALKQRLTGKTFRSRGADGREFQVQYQDQYAYVDVYLPAGTMQDSGPWRVEGSSACVQWQKVKSGCSEFRLVGDVLYTKRASNGEVVVMTPK